MVISWMNRRRKQDGVGETALVLDSAAVGCVVADGVFVGSAPAIWVRLDPNVAMAAV